VTALLEHVRRDGAPYSVDYVSALPIAGYDGTLQGRFTRSPLKGLVRGKTGTLNNYGASNLAGYVRMHGKPYVFTILINCPRITQFSHWVMQQKILEATASALE
jgi:D-alanyl-D-alanine carboxypeptidase/D-alanyl-D-alanine-endopeptidase (penicillin-binding protein 4)